MASRQADSRRFAEDRRDRPTRDRRDDRRDGRHRDDRYRDRDRDRERDRYDGHAYRRRTRSRSPVPHRRRDRSRDGHAYRYDERDRAKDYRDRHYSRDREDVHPNRERDRERDRTLDRDSRRGSQSSISATPGADVRRNRADDRLPRDDKRKRDEEKPKEVAQNSKLARLEKWKQQQLQKKANAQAAQPSATQERQSKDSQKAPPTDVKDGITQKATDGKPQDVTMTDADSGSTVQIVKSEQKISQQTQQTDVSKGNVQLKIGNFKSIQAEKKSTTKDVLMADADSKYNPLQSGDSAKRNRLVRLEEWKEDAQPNKDDSQMEKVDDAEDEVDPLDAFMNGLDSTPNPTDASTAKRGEAMFGEDAEPDFLEPVADDLYAIMPKKKKKEIPTVDHSKITYEPFRKNFYTEPSEISEMSAEDVADLRLELDGIKVKPSNVPRPVVKWAQMGLSQATLDVIHELGYTRPTSIQSQAIPVILSGRDMIGVAKTGSGKTLAFGVPIIRHVLDQPPLKSQDGPIALILAPTRELSLQIVHELKPFMKAANLKIACAYGGAPIADQIAAIKRGAHVLCATPGRLIDLLQSNQGRVLKFNRVTYVVIDEADRMFDMGFGPQVMKITANIRPDRQSLLFSATFPKSMADLARKTLTHPAEVIIGGLSVVAPEITQIVEVVPAASPDKKMARVLLHLGQLFTQDEDSRALLFVERQEMAEELLNRCMKLGYPCNSIHGARDQSDRADAIRQFKNGAQPILIATSVAARGLDVPQLKLVINYDCPTHLEDYVHRCGRTGRAGNKGTAVTLIENPGQERFAVHISKALKQSGQKIPDDLKQMTDVFMKKVKEGTEKWFDPGFGGKGLDKLDAARLLEKKREKRAHKTEFDDDSDSEPETLPTTVNNAVSTTTPAAGTPTATTEEEPAYMQLLRRSIVVHKTERPAESAKGMSALERVKAATQAVNARLSKKGTIHHGQPIDNKGPDAGAFHATIEINDFPQKARWAVTNRTNVAKILEQTGTSITTKGNYYPPGSAPKEETDLPKLYILVEGDTENVVQSAMGEIRRHLREATEAAAEAPRGATGRYSVM